MIVTNDYKFSSNVTEVIRSFLNFLLFFYESTLHTPKAHKLLTVHKNKNKKTHKKTSSKEKKDFFKKILHTPKAQKLLTVNKNKKNTHKKTSTRKEITYSLICFSCFQCLKIAFSTSPQKLVFVRIYESTFIGLVGPLYFCLRFMLLFGCIFVLLVFFNAFRRFQFFSKLLMFFSAFVVCKIFLQNKIK